MWSKQLWTCWWYVQSSGFKRRCLACSPSLWSLGKLRCHSISEGGKETWLYFTRVIFYFHDFVFLISIFLFSWCLLHYFSLVIQFGFGEACVCLFSGTWPISIYPREAIMLFCSCCLCFFYFYFSFSFSFCCAGNTCRYKKSWR